MRKILKVILTLGIMAIILLVAFAPLLRQEGNPLPYLSAAARLSIYRTDIEAVSSNRGIYIYRSNDGIGPLVELLETQGWEFQEQMGAGIVFYREGIIMTALTRPYSRFYNIASIPSGRQEPEQPAQTSITLTATGDILMHNTLIAAGKQGGEYNFDFLFASVKHLIEAGDYASVNLESALAGPDTGYTGYPRFNSPDALADSLKKAGFDLAITANNHILDRGLLGAMRTMDILHQAGLDTTGTFKTPEEKTQYLIKEINGIRVGYLAYGYGTNGMSLPENSDYFYNFLDREQILADIAALRPQVDVLVLVLHWGVEYQPLPTAEQRTLAREFLAQGADLILGSHPHVIQPIETIQINNKQKLVIYSMGNSMGDQNGLERNSGVILNVQFTKDRQSGNTCLSGFSYTPIYIHSYYNQSHREFRVIPIEETIQLIKSGEDLFLREKDISMLEQIWADIDAQITRPLP